MLSNYKLFNKDFYHSQNMANIPIEISRYLGDARTLVEVLACCFPRLEIALMHQSGTISNLERKKKQTTKFLIFYSLLKSVKKFYYSLENDVNITLNRFNRSKAKVDTALTLFGVKRSPVHDSISKFQENLHNGVQS